MRVLGQEVLRRHVETPRQSSLHVGIDHDRHVTLLREFRQRVADARVRGRIVEARSLPGGRLRLRLRMPGACGGKACREREAACRSQAWHARGDGREGRY